MQKSTQVYSFPFSQNSFVVSSVSIGERTFVLHDQSSYYQEQDLEECFHQLQTLFRKELREFSKLSRRADSAQCERLRRTLELLIEAQAARYDALPEHQ